MKFECYVIFMVSKWYSFCKLLSSIYKYKKHSLNLLFFFSFFFLGPHPWQMEVPRLGVELELQLLVYATATAMQDLSHICDLHHSSQQHRSLTHWARPGIEPASSRMLVGFSTAEPQGELPENILISQDGQSWPKWICMNKPIKIALNFH